MVAGGWAAHGRVSSQRPQCADRSKPGLRASQPGCPVPAGPRHSCRLASPRLCWAHVAALLWACPARVSGFCLVQAPLHKLRGLQGGAGLGAGTSGERQLGAEDRALRDEGPWGEWASSPHGRTSGGS